MNESSPPKKSKPRISEKQRTVILLVLLSFTIGFIYWIQNGIDQNFIETF